MHSQLAEDASDRQTRAAMLDARWRQIVAPTPHALALREGAGGRTWTFAELAAAADAGSLPTATGPVFPTGHGLEFILTVLRAWRAKRPVCPLETGQPAPAFTEPPPGIAQLKLTSGTTGAIKCVAFTATQLAADAAAIVATMGLRPGWPNLGVISLAHSYGFSNLVLPLLLHGIPLVLVPSPLPALLADTAHLLGDTPLTLAAVPAMWRAWHEAGVIPPTVRLAISAAAPLPLPLEEAVFAGCGLKLHNFLGATECGGIAYDRSEQPRTDASFAGQPLRGVDVVRCATGGLEVRGAAVGETYWPEPEERLSGGVYRADDLVDIAEDGGVWLRGRAGDVINVAGRKLSPEAIESVLRRHPAVRECLALSLPDDEHRGETVGVVVELKFSADELELRDFLLAQLPAWQVPRAWHFVETLAPNGRGKLSRADWRRRWHERSI